MVRGDLVKLFLKTWA